MEIETNHIIVIAEHSQGNIQSITFELIHAAQILQQYAQCPIHIIVIDNEPEPMANELARMTGYSVFAVQIPGLENYNSESYKHALELIFMELKPIYVCIAATSQGNDFAPGLAIKMDAACIPGIIQIQGREGQACFTRLTQGCKIAEHYVSESDITILTIQPGSFKSDFKENTSLGIVEKRKIVYQPKQSFSKGIKHVDVDTSSLTDAKVIISTGRGIQKKENLDYIFRLAKIFHHASIACSRPICDAGWLPYSYQIGATGTTVKPKLYLACGISGASQHIQGIMGSDFIVAINSDKNAAIFNIADICIVEDMMSFIDVLIDEYQKFSV